MTIETGLRTLLLAEATITNIVGSIGVYVGDVEQATALPYIVIDKTSIDPLVALDGTSGLRFKDFDFDCFAATKVGAQTLADALSTYLDDYTGATGADDTINAVLWEDESDEFLRDDQGGDQGKHLVTLDMQVQYTPN